jgi:hypothetical protein
MTRISKETKIKIMTYGHKTEIFYKNLRDEKETHNHPRSEVRMGGKFFSNIKVTFGTCTNIFVSFFTVFDGLRELFMKN